MARHRPIDRYRSRRSKPFYKKAIFYILCLTGISIYLLWIWNKIFIWPHRFDFLSFSINGEIRRVLNGETVILHPLDRVRIINISTNVPFNLYVRLFSEGLDIVALSYEEKMLLSLLSEKDIYRKYKFRIEVKFKNQDIGYVDCIVKPFFEDWLKRFESLKDLDEKREFLNKGFSLFPEQKQDIIKLKLGLAQEFKEKGMLNGAIKTYLELLQYSEQMDKDTVLSMYEALGYLCAKTKKYKDAIRYYKLAIDMGDKNPEVYYNVYELYNITGDKNRASYYLAKLLELKPRDVETRIELAKTLFEKGDVTRADKCISEALAINPKSLDALALKAKILDKKGDKKGLVSVYKKILALEPKNNTIIYNLALVEYELNNMKEALSYLNDYMKVNPKDKDAHELLFQIYRAKKMDEAAFKEAKILTSISPGLAYPYYFIFNYLWPKGRCEKIIPFINKGLRYNPKDITLRKYIVLCYLYKGKDALAIRQIRYILKLRPNDVSTLSQLARLMEKRGNYSEALRIYKKIIKISPDNEEAQNGYLRLRLKGIKEMEDME